MATTLLAAGVKSALGHDSATARVVRHLPQIRTNVSSTERFLSMGLGSALLGIGFDGRGPGLASGLIGGYLLYRAATGNCPTYQALGVSTSDATAEESVI